MKACKRLTLGTGMRCFKDPYLGEYDCMAAKLLGSDVRRVLGQEKASDLVGRFRNESEQGVQRLGRQRVRRKGALQVNLVSAGFAELVC